MARTKLYLDTGKTRKMMGEAIFSVCKTSSNRARINAELGRASNRMVRGFEEHPITTEIAGGPNASNSSGTLGGYGNLFSFIGFQDGTDPLSAIREVINAESFKIRDVLKRGPVVTMILSSPKASDVFSRTEMPWAGGRSWAKGIEAGISGLGYYLNTYWPSGRSTTGVQTKFPIERNGTKAGTAYKPTKYISDLIARYTREAIQSVTSGNLIS